MTTTNVLDLPARPGAPVACDMSGAADTAEGRLREYAALFEGSLVRRERRAGAVVFEFGGDDPATRAAVEDLARREAACCPFLGYRVDVVSGRVVWTITAPAGPAEAVLDAFNALAAGEAVRTGPWPGASSPSRTSTGSPAGATNCAG
jgi:hypothetical protein